MPSDPYSQRDLLHRLNGQLLRRLDALLRIELPETWSLENWIINVILLHRSPKRVPTPVESQGRYTARLETSATYHRGELFDTTAPFDYRVASLDVPVTLGGSFSGYSITTSDVVWIDDLQKLERESKHPLAQFYRSFGLVGVETPTARPTAEYVFPLLVQIGLNHTILGVLNMEYFAPPAGPGSPFNRENQLIITDIITRLLNAHSPFLLTAEQEEMGAVLSDGGDEAADVRESFLRIHRKVLDKHNWLVATEGSATEAEEP
jgi:hypothetical protein